MEAMILGYPPEQAGQISVTATKEEWRAVVDAVTSSYAESDTSASLVYWLINQGVYE